MKDVDQCFKFTCCSDWEVHFYPQFSCRYCTVPNVSLIIKSTFPQKVAVHKHIMSYFPFTSNLKMSWCGCKQGVFGHRTLRYSSFENQPKESISSINLIECRIYKYNPKGYLIHMLKTLMNRQGFLCKNDLLLQNWYCKPTLTQVIACHTDESNWKLKLTPPSWF